MNFKCIKNKSEYIQFIDNIRDKFDCIEDWEDYFGFHLKWNEATGEMLETIFDYQGEIEYCPHSFPCILYVDMEERYDRFGAIIIRLMNVDYATFDELGINEVISNG